MDERKKAEFLKKYNVPGPRYTSYPTVPYWETTPTEQEWVKTIAQALSDSNNTLARSASSFVGPGPATGAAIYIHIPFCHSLCTYCGCNTRVTRNRGLVAPYLRAVQTEWELYLQKLAALDSRYAKSGAVKVSELHLGGGTPTYLTPDELKRLISGIVGRAQADPSAEFSIEADPRVTTREHLAALRELGFRRLSLGIQDFDSEVQEIVHRVQSEEQVRQVTETARDLGFDSVNYDLVYGLPKQTIKSIADTVDAVRRLKPDRIAFYAYAHVPWIKPAHRRWTEADLPAGEAKRALYETGRHMFESVGYREIGMDHFALESDSLWSAAMGGTLHRNFMGYITRQVSPLIGLGVSSIGDSWNAFSQNEKVLEAYQARIEKGELPIHRGHVLTEEDRVLRYHVLKLMTRFETSWKEPEIYTPFMDTVAERLSELSRDGLVEIDKMGCRITGDGRPFLRNICMAFDARLVRKAPATQLFSKTI